MVLCWAPGCKHYNVRETYKFYKFPASGKERLRWKKLVRRDVEPGPGAYLCSCHFVDGKRESGPVLFAHNKDKRFTFTSPKKKKIKLDISDPIAQSSSCVPEQEPDQEIPCHSAEVEIVSISRDNPQPGPSYATDVQIGSDPQPEKDLEDLKQKYNARQFTYDSICNNNELVSMYTGLPNNSVFCALYNLLKDLEINYYLKWQVQIISKKDQLFMTLMKLRRNFPHLDLAVRFNVSQATVTNVVLTWVYILHQNLYENLILILDCTEIYTEVSRKSMSTQRETYSTYKHHNTWKGLVGVAPNGVITYLSSLYPASTSDKKIVQHYGVLEQLEPGDLILADKGFLIGDILPAGLSVLLAQEYTWKEQYVG
ncbi:uncharacterized protein LOC116162110 [Photinus pyralis]|uniref:uncharacterized protein LOC116162110 n=1 Tax=Photinus pyralis TaxID=7054 RepID=UPI001266E729|nr:uncharacterized protein LOC116162110 [Photinus pyralis]